MSRVSVCLAVYNEEKNIARCLKSVKSWAWEMVVVDGRSDDKTSQIARKFKARIFTRENFENFHINKKYAINKAKGDWILQLDADEEVPENLASEIISAVRKGKHDGYYIPRKNYFLGKWLSKGGQYPDYTLRLYRKGKGNLPAINVHEQAVVQGTKGFLKNSLNHYNNESFSEYLEHFGRYTGIFSKEIKGRVRFFQFFDYMLVKPLVWFFKAFIRHKGFYDGWQGFLFAFMSAMRFPLSYIKYLKNKKNDQS